MTLSSVLSFSCPVCTETDQNYKRKIEWCYICLHCLLLSYTFGNYLIIGIASNGVQIFFGSHAYVYHA